MTTNFEPHECLIYLKSTKIGTHENKAIHSIWHAYSTNDALSNDTKVNDIVTLTSTLKLKIAFWTLLPPRA